MDEQRYSNVDVKAVIEKIKSRKCPACGKDITEYRNCGLYIPFDKRAIAWHFLFAEGEERPFFPVSQMSIKENLSLCFSSVCECGFVSLWNLSSEEIASIIVSDCDIKIEELYNKKIWETYLSKTKNEAVKRGIEDTVNFIDKLNK